MLSVVMGMMNPALSKIGGESVSLTLMVRINRINKMKAAYITAFSKTLET
jgi:hypothetical protein